MLIEALGIPFEVKPVDVDENLGSEAAKKPAEYVLAVARLKARAAFDLGKNMSSGTWFLAADTIVVLEGEILGKPRDKIQAAQYLRALSGREHAVFSAFTLIENPTGKEFSRTVKTLVKMKELSDHEIEGYIGSGEPLDKAGAYAAQGLGSFMIESINGSYTNVVGLPMAELVDELRKHNIARPFEGIR